MKKTAVVMFALVIIVAAAGVAGFRWHEKEKAKAELAGIVSEADAKLGKAHLDLAQLEIDYMKLEMEYSGIKNDKSKYNESLAILKKMTNMGQDLDYAKKRHAEAKENYERITQGIEEAELKRLVVIAK